MAIHSKLKKNEIQKILNQYNLKLKFFSFLTEGIENTNVLINTNREKYVLKIIEEKDMKKTKFQVEFINFLTKYKVSTPKIIKTQEGKSITKYGKKPVLLFEFSEGKHPNRINKELLEDIIFKISNLQKKSLMFKPKNKPRIKLANDLSVEKSFLSRLKQKQSKKKLLEDVYRLLLKLDYKKIRKGVIHGDLTKVNLLVKNNKLLSILDFDDVRFDYLTHDIATLMLKICFKEDRLDEKTMRIFIKEYDKRLKLNKEEKKSLFIFMRKRILSSIIYFWYLADSKRGDKKQNKELLESFERINKELEKYGEVKFEKLIQK